MGPPHLRAGAIQFRRSKELAVPSVILAQKQNQTPQFRLSANLHLALNPDWLDR
jgi:hypothetical protein